MNMIIVVSISVAAVAEFAFVMRFARTPWWRSPEGRVIMVKDIVLMAMFGLALLGVLYPDWLWREWVRVVVWVSVATVFVAKTALFYRRQAEGRRLRSRQRVSASDASST